MRKADILINYDVIAMEKKDKGRNTKENFLEFRTRYCPYFLPCTS
jgi:hypothetical protein